MPLALLPCRAVLGMVAVLLRPADRAEWTDEWLAEIWAHYIEGRGIWRMYRATAGCLPDAWWHFTEECDGKRRFLDSTRSPEFCLLGLFLLFTICTIASGCLPATRAILEPLPFVEQNRVALVSRTGRLEPIRRGIPGSLATQWCERSKLMRGFAMCLFPRKTTISAGGHTTEALRILTTPNLLPLLGANVPVREWQDHSVWISEAFRKRTFGGGEEIAGRSVTIGGSKVAVAGVLPANFWFLSPAIDVFENDNSLFAAQGMLVVRAKPEVTVQALESELVKTAADEGVEFTRTAPHIIFLRQAMQTPLWLFGAAFFIAAVLVALAEGPRWMRIDDPADLLPFGHWRWLSFFAVKTILGLVIVLAVGVELFVERSQHAISDSLGGPALIWFYVVGCSLVLFASISDQRSRCRVCLRLLSSPIRIGCPGCLLLDWAGTEFLCPHGHGVLYVPHHVACWEEADRWILLEV